MMWNDGICDDGTETKPYEYNPLEDEEENDDEEMKMERGNNNDSGEDNCDTELI